MFENGCGLVEDDERSSGRTCLDAHGARNLDHLAIDERQVANARLWVQIDTDLVQHGGGVFVDARPVPNTQLGPAILLHVLVFNIFGHCEVGEQRLFLVDDADAGLHGVVWPAEFCDGAIDFHFALVGVLDACENLQKRRFSGSVFPGQADDFAAPDFE